MSKRRVVVEIVGSLHDASDLRELVREEIASQRLTEDQERVRMTVLGVDFPTTSLRKLAVAINEELTRRQWEDDFQRPHS